MESMVDVGPNWPGPETSEALDELRAYETRGEVYFPNYGTPPVVERASGSYVQDIEGNTYLDFTSGFAALNLGHCPRKVIDAVVIQLNLVHHTAVLPTMPRVKLVEKLNEIAPGPMKHNCRVQFDISGTNAVEIGMKYAKAYTKRPLFLCYSGAYHGRSHGTLAVTGGAYFKKAFYPILAGAERLPYPYCYRCHYGREYGSCDMQCLKSLDNMLGNPSFGLVDAARDTNLVAGLIFEACQGSGGMIIPPQEYWKGVREICDRYDILMIDDEVQMGFGRSGKLFAIETYDTYPDIMVVGKAFSAGITSNAAVIARNEIMDSFLPAYQNVTFSGNPLGCAASLAMLETLEEENVLDNVKTMGSYFLEELKSLEEKHTIIGNVQGRGLVLGIEFVNDRKTKEPASKQAIAIVHEMIPNGLITTISGPYRNRINVVPPLTVKKDEIDAAIKIMDKVIAKVAQ